VCVIPQSWSNADSGPLSDANFGPPAKERQRRNATPVR
jgi:hypothetical protein